MPVAIRARRGVAEVGHPAGGQAAGERVGDQDGEGGGEGVADGLAEDGAEPGVEQLEACGMRRRCGRVGGVGADAGDEQHPSGEADDLDGGGGDAGDRRSTVPRVPPAMRPRQDAGGGEQGGADDEDEEPAGDGGLVLAVEGEDLGGSDLEDGRVVEDRSEGGEPGDGQQGGRAMEAAASRRGVEWSFIVTFLRVVGGVSGVLPWSVRRPGTTSRVAARASSSGVAASPNAGAVPGCRRRPSGR